MVLSLWAKQSCCRLVVAVAYGTWRKSRSSAHSHPSCAGAKVASSQLLRRLWVVFWKNSSRPLLVAAILGACCLVHVCERSVMLFNREQRSGKRT